MNLTLIEKELKALISLTERWDEQGYTPAIERDIALTRVRNIYGAMLELQAEVAAEPELERVFEPSDVKVADGVDDDQVIDSENEELIEDVVVDVTLSVDQKQEPSEDDQQRRRFIHDLFCNDETFFEQEMHKISLLETMDDVYIYIGEKYAWAPDNSVAEEFIALVSERFNEKR